MYFQSHCGCAAYKCSGGNCESRIGNSPTAFKEQVGNVNDETSMLVGTEFVKDDTGPIGKNILLDQSAELKGQLPKTTVCHASQWRDVPSKFKGVCDVTYLDQSADVLDGRGHVEGQLGGTATKCSYGTMKIPDSLKEQEMSNISSGCSAAAVTHTSVPVNNIDSCTVNAENSRCINNHAVDEGSGIDKCWSSDDALESERSSEFLDSNSKEGSFNIRNNQSSRSLLDELKLLNSLTWKKSRNQIHSRLGVHGKINSKKNERGFKMGKRKRARKFKKLESQFPTAGPSTVHYDCSKGTSSKDVEMLHPSFQETHVSGACSLQPSSKCIRSTFSSSKELSRKRDLHMIYGDGEGEGEGDYQVESNSSANGCKNHDFAGIKKSRKAWNSDCIENSHTEEPTHARFKNTVRCRSVSYIEASFSGEVDNCLMKRRPVVCGKYGEICSGEPAGDVASPAKIVSLSRILKTSQRCTLPKNYESKQAFLDGSKKTNFCGRDADSNGFSIEIHHSSICNEMKIETFLEEDEKICTNADKLFDEKKSILEKENDNGIKKNGSSLRRNVHAKFKPKSKEIRKRSLCELTEKGNYPDIFLLFHLSTADFAEFYGMDVISNIKNSSLLILAKIF